MGGIYIHTHTYTWAYTHIYTHTHIHTLIYSLMLFLQFFKAIPFSPRQRVPSHLDLQTYREAYAICMEMSGPMVFNKQTKIK